ncbi:hypothetical protein [Apilactobacillus quenuiae]|uniref:hypothetical protein n=1 Tax=Apilactobacillus quenuiae TaxID=2008377 RepID=UPI000D019CD7|nr:hypothetical protein [Apilactobacillus quenuiae]
MAVEADTIKPPSWKQLFAETWWLHPKYKHKTAFIADGSIRTGKTMWMSLGFVQWEMNQFNGFDFIMAGKTIMSLRRNVIKGLIKRLRGLGYVITDKKSENMLIITLGDVTNPFHYFKIEWIDGRTKKNAIRLHFNMQDNPILTKKDIEDASNMYTGAFYERYILGNWVSADGLILP